MDQEAESHEEQHCASDDTSLEPTNAIDYSSKDEASENRAETVQAQYARGVQNGKVECNDENGVEEVSLGGPGEVEHDCNSQGTPHCAVF